MFGMAQNDRWLQRGGLNPNSTYAMQGGPMNQGGPQPMQMPQQQQPQGMGWQQGLGLALMHLGAGIDGQRSQAPQLLNAALNRQGQETQDRMALGAAQGEANTEAKAELAERNRITNAALASLTPEQRNDPRIMAMVSGAPETVLEAQAGANFDAYNLGSDTQRRQGPNVMATGMPGVTGVAGVGVGSNDYWRGQYGQNSGGGNLPTVTNQAEYDQIQPGQEYMDGNGVRRRRPGGASGNAGSNFRY